jgi:formate/nitrite transporter
MRAALISKGDEAPAVNESRLHSPVTQTASQESFPAAAPLFDAYAPAEVAKRVREVGIAKAKAPAAATFVLAVLAGAFIALGALFFTITMTTGAASTPLPFGLLRLAAGITFSLGLILVVVGGAELFTGNNLLAMAWASGRVTSTELLRNWALVYLGNLVGSAGTALLVWLADVQQLSDGAVGDMMVTIARAKMSMDPMSTLARGILCNALVCLAVWLCMAARSVADKILAILFPISAFVACGFEHSVANMYFLPIGIALASASQTPLSIAAALSQLLLVTIGNMLGGTLLVALVYWAVYLRKDSSTSPKSTSARTVS